MVKTPKKLKKEKSSLKIIKLRRRFRRIKKNKSNESNTIFTNYISAIPSNNLIVQNISNNNPIIGITEVLELLYNIFSIDTAQSHKSLNDLNFIVNNVNEELFTEFGKLLSPQDFYRIFLSYLKKKIAENKIQDICKSSSKTYYYLLFKNLKDEDINLFLFNKNISSYIRQDIILSIFDYDKKILNEFIAMLNMEDNFYSLINKNNLIIDESIEEYKENYLFSNSVINSIKLTLSKFINNIDEKIIKETISQLLNKIKFYFANIDEKFAGITFLGYNVIIRNYFKNFKDKSIKVALRNVIAHELIHILIIELTDGNFFTSSFERSQFKIRESGDYFEKLFFGIDVKFYSSSLISYLENFDNFNKNLNDFNKDIIKIYKTTCKNDENKIEQLTDLECITKGIVRNKYNDKNEYNDSLYGHCWKHYISHAICFNPK